MAEIDVSKTEYKVNAVTPSGENLNLTQYVTACTWSDSRSEVAARASVTFANRNTDKGYISNILKLCTLLFIFANGQEVFRGVVWEWEYTSAAQKEVSVTAYDKMIYATKSKDNSYYTAGKSTSAIVQDICGRWGISVNYQWQNYTHAKTPYKNKAVSEQIMETLEEAAKKTNSKYVAYMDKDVLQIKQKGANPDVYIFDTKNSISIKNKLSLSKLVTKVIIVGKEDKEGRVSIEETVNGDTQYGTIQEIVHRDSNSTLADAQAEANELINERGKPEETITLQAPDVPFLRKGDKIKVIAGNFDSFLYVLGVTHNAVDRTMNVECERA